MKLSDIKTMKQFWEAGDVWYQRTFKLLDIWNNESEKIERRRKAFKIWSHYTILVMKFHKIASEIQNKPHNFPLGGVTNI